MDERLKWLETRISSSLRPRNEELKAMLASDENRLAFHEFIKNEDMKSLYVFVRPPRKIIASLKAPHGLYSKSIFFMKSQGAKLTRDNIGEEVTYTDCDGVLLDDIDLVTRDVFLPLLCSDESQISGSAVSADRLMDQLHRITANAEVSSGYLKGEVILPLPSVEVLAEAAATPARRGAVLHVLESTIVGWMKQIKGLLKHEPVEDLERIYGKRPGPLDELSLWEKRQLMLQSIELQLDSAVAKDIIMNLEEAESQYATSFQQIRGDISKSLRDTTEILQFWDTMKPWFIQLHEAVDPLEQLRLLPPILHTILLVWQYSRYYHQPGNFSTLLRVISNEIVHRATAVIGDDIMTEPLESYTRLKDALKVCAAFRGTYLDYRDKSDEINNENIKGHADNMTHNAKGDQLFATKLYGPYAYQPQYGLSAEDQQGSVDNLATDRDLHGNSPWPPRNAPCFNVLNAFLERCNDVLELVQTTRHFSLLSDAATVGGAGSQSLDALVKEIDCRYREAMQVFCSSVENVLEIDGTQAFEKAFFCFRSVVKMLEVQLSEIIRQGFSQCPTVGSQLRLLEVFEGISSRELVQANLKDKDKLLVHGFSSELSQVKTMFQYFAKSPPLHKNMPSVVSKIQWIHALRQRIVIPMEKLKLITPQLLDGDSGWHLRDTYTECLAEFDQYENRVINKWQEGITSELTEKLKQPVMVAEDYDEETELRPQVIHVNLDPSLLLLLREIHYLSSEPFLVAVPAAARELVRNTGPYMLNVIATRLETIVSKYNTIMKMIGDYERPLFERKLARIDQLLDKGLNQLTWRSKDLNDFIEAASLLVCTDVHVNLDIVQSNCREIADAALGWCKGALDFFSSRDKSKSYNMADLIVMQNELEEHIESDLVPAGIRIHFLVDGSFKAVGISKASPAWEDYMDFLDAVVLNGLKQTSLASLKAMWYQMSEATLMKETVPILTIRLELIQNRVTFRPPLEESTSVTSVQEVVNKWMSGFLDRGHHVNMLGPKGAYQEYIEADEEIKALCDDITKVVRKNDDECQTLLSIFSDYSFLWELDVTETFAGFLKGQISPNPRRSTAQHLDGPSRMRQQAAARSSTSSRSSSAKSIESVGIVGTAEKSFLSQTKEEEEEAVVPTLDEFDAEIDIYRTARDEIMELQPKCDIGWIRVDLEPVKQVLITHASKWMWTFTSYLAEQVTKMLTSLDTFLKRIEPEIESIRGDERDTASFMKMMRLFNEVTAQQQEMDIKFAAMHRTVLLLKKYNQTLPEHTQYLFNAAPGRWNNLKTKVSLAKQRLGPRIQEESERITKDLAAFGQRVRKLEQELDESPVFSFDFTMSDAWVALAQFSKQLSVLENEAQDLAELQDLLEANVVNFEILPKCRLTIENLKKVWEAVRVLGEEQNDWKSHRWHKINTSQLRTATDKQLGTLKRLPEEANLWDVYHGLQDSIINIQTCLPLIDDLSNPAMRTRHWKQLVRVTGGAVQIDNDTLKRMTLGELLSLGLQTHVDDVRAIVQRAVKDLAIEKSLKTYEEVWLSKLFELRIHIRSKSVDQGDAIINDNQSEISHTESHASHRPSHTRSGSRVSGQSSLSKLRRGSSSSLPASLLNMGEDTGILSLLTHTEPIFDELESHQVALQTMHGSSAAGSFMDEVVKWQKRLQTIEAVLSLWLEVQDKWTELEEIYSTAEIRTSLAKDAHLFDEINRDFRLLMRATEKNPNVLQCCSRRNILSILERMKAALSHCHKSLLHQLSRRLQKFPRFYFLSLEDVLHIICNGYDLRQINSYISKLFENVGELTYTEPDDSEKNMFEITGIKSILGEHLPLKQAIPCEGQIESWLPLLLNSITTALQSQLAVVMGTEAPAEGKDGKTKRAIRSAGSRKIVVQSSHGSRPGSKQKAAGKPPGSRAGKKPDEKRSSVQHPEAIPEQTEEPETKSWTLDNVTEIVYLATQLQMTQRVSEACQSVEQGDKHALVNAIIKVNTSLQESVLLLKGFETKQESLEASRATSVEKTESERAKSRGSETKASESKTKSETASQPGGTLLGEKKSRQGNKPGSTRGSMFDLTHDQGAKSPIPEGEEGHEEGQASSLAQQDIDEPAAPEPVNTMDLGDTFNQLIVKKDTEEEQIEFIEQADIRLMLFPSQIHKIGCIIALLTYYRDLLQRLQDWVTEEHAEKPSSSFVYKSQLHYHFQPENKAIDVKCLDMTFDYDYEYLGSANREVISPVCERVFVNLVMAFKEHFGTIISGPMGSGRLETVHELSRMLGRPFYWFNCHGDYDAVMLHNVFKGLALTGSWVCFNNLNYLSSPVLSEFARLMSVVLGALREGKTTAHLSGEELQLHSKAACMAITTNLIKVSTTSPDVEPIFPSVVAQMPHDIIKQFRQFSILKPDLRLTVEAMLLGQGFTNAATLAKKSILAQELCVNLGGLGNLFSTSPSIGTETRAGWSLQSLKHIIIQAGSLLDKLTSDNMAAQYETIHELPDEDDDSITDDVPVPLQPEEGEVHPPAAPQEKAEAKEPAEAAQANTKLADDERLIPEKLLADEELSIVSAIRDTFLPRLGERDRILFSSIILDLWPNVEVPLDFAGGQTDRGRDDLPTTAPSKTNSRPHSRTTATPTKNRSKKNIIPGIKDSLNLNTSVVAITASRSKHEADTKIHEPLDSIDDAIAVATSSLGLLPGVAFQARVLQLAHLSNAHKSILVVGPSGCGKSECIKTYAVAERERGKSLNIQSVFTKAFEPKAFLGYFNESNEWTDGLLPHILRKYCAKAASSHLQPENKASIKVVLLDGECDPSQMEIMGSVLHNDGSIVLGNNERIPMSGHVRFIWESDSLKNISPAILANVGLLVMNREDLGWQMLLTHWLNHRPDEHKILLGEFAEAYIPKVVDFMLKATNSPVAGRKPKGIPSFTRCIKHHEENMVSTFCSLFEALTSNIMDEVSEEVYERYFAFAVIWSFAGTLSIDDQEAFSDWWRKSFEGRITWPFSGTVFDYAIDAESKEFTNWGNIIATYNGTPHVGIPNDAFVHTVSNGQLYYLLSQLSDLGKSVMLVGEAGCGKSSIIKERIRNVSTGEVAEVLALNISANRFTNSGLMYDRLNEKLEWKHGRTYVPKGNKRLICLVDDLNLSHVDQHGYQSAVELIRQHLDEGGFYSADNLQWRYVRNVTYVSTVNPKPNVSVPQLSSRLLRHFALFNCPAPGPKELERIYRTLLHTHFVTPELQATSSISASAAQHLGITEEKSNSSTLRRPVKAVINTEDEALKNLLTLLVGVTIQLQSKLSQMFLHTAKRCHYSFSMKDLSVIFRNLTLSLKVSCTTENLLWLWQHECDFVYGSRMVSEVDRNRYETAFRTAVKKDFHHDDQIKQLHTPNKPLFSNLVEQDSGAVTAGEPVPISHRADEYHCDDYRPHWDNETAKGLLVQAIEEYNKVYPKIRLSLYNLTIQHVCRLARVISSPHEVAHLHIIGEGSPGVTSTMVKLAAHLSDFTTVQINSSLNVMCSGNQLDLFKAELVSAYTRAGVKHERILFLLHEDELFNENFLVFITEFIVSSSITHLFTPEETTTIINSIRTDVTQAGLTYTKEVAWNFFLNTVKNNFRICLISADGSNTFQKRCRDFPSLITCLNYIWLPHWSKNQLVEHANYHIKDVEWMTALQKENISHMLASMHLVIRQADGKEETSGTYNNLTNTAYEKFIERYISLAKRRYEEIITQHETITTALDQIYKENDLAAKLHKQLEHEKIVLDERIAGTTKILAQIGQDTAITEQQVKIVKQQLEKIKKLKKLLPEYQVAHERAVFKASALAIDTKKIVAAMTMESLQELRAMQKPIIEVEDLMAAIIMILKSPTADLTWQKGAKRQMANLERFIEELNTFDDQQMAETTLVLVEPYLKKASFDPESLEKKSSNTACHSLCKWVHGVVKYHRMMISKVKPLHDKVVSTTSAVDNAEHKMATLDSKRKALEVRLKDLAKGFEDATIDKNDQAEKTVKMDRMLITAASLREALQNETARAEQVHKSLQTRLACVNGAVSMAAAFCTYLGPYGHNFRRMMLTVQWPHCLRERGVPLVIDTVDHIRGRVVDFAIEGLAPDLDDFDEKLPSTPRSSRKYGSRRDGAASEAGVESLPDDDLYMGDEGEGEGETTLLDESTVVDDPTLNQPAAVDQSMLSSDRSAPPTRQKDGQPLEPLHEVEERHTDADKSQKSMSGDMPPGQGTLIEEPVTVSAIVTKLQYKTYISSLVRLLVGEQLQLRWIRKDLDARQMENAAILSSSWQRPPLIIDPYDEGSQFILEYSKSVQRKSLNTADDNVIDQSGIVAVEKAITVGKPVLVSGIKGKLNNMIMPLIYHYNTLNEDHLANGEPKMISYCGRRLLCHPRLQLYLSTPVARPQIGPVLSSLSTMVSYSTDADSLTDKLFTRTFARVRPNLFKEKLLVLKNIHTLKELMNQIIEYARRDMKEVSGGKIWNEDDVKVIAEGMKLKEEVATKLRENVELLHKLQGLQDELLPVARRGALIYTVLRSLSSISPHYQFKLPQFLQIFYEAVGEDPPPDVFVEDEEDLQELNDSTREDQAAKQTAESSKNRSNKEQTVTSLKSTDNTANTSTTAATTAVDEPGEGYTDDFEGEEGARPDIPTPASRSTVSDAVPGEHNISPFMQVLETIPNFPSEGVDYAPLQANQTKQLVDALTDRSMRYARLSLDGDHQLLFNAVMCLAIQKGSEEFFSEEELSLLTQGNPGLGLSLSLDDFGCEAKVPEWLPKDRWENVMAISVLPGPLDNLCVRIAESPERWQKWYKSDTPERQMVSQAPDQDDTQTESSNHKESRKSEDGDTPKANSEKAEEAEKDEMSDFHKLLVLRMLRPDRLHYALSDYVDRHMPVEQTDPVSYNQLKTYIGVHNLATMIVLPTSSTCVHSTTKIDLDLVTLLSNAAKARNIEFSSVTMADGCFANLDSMLDVATKTEADSWFLIDKLHLAPDSVLKVIKKRLQTAVRTKVLPSIHNWNFIKETEEPTPQLMVWITTEPSERVPVNLLDSVVSISWHYITKDFFGAGETRLTSAPLACLTDSLTKGIVTSLGLPSADLWSKVGQHLQSIKVLTFAIGVVHGVLSSRQIVGTAGLSQWYPFCSVQMCEAIQVAISTMFADLDEQLMLENKISFLSQHVFSRMMSSEEDSSLAMNISAMILRGIVFNTIGILTYGNYNIHLPPANVEPSGYSRWFEDKQAEGDLSTIKAIGLHTGAQKQHDNYRSVKFLDELDRLSEAQNSDSIEMTITSSAALEGLEVNTAQLNMLCLNCLERLPALLELGSLTPVSASSHYNFPYHPPSAYSDASSIKGLMPESIGHVLLQECFYMNALLCHIRQTLYDITEALISGPDGLPMQHVETSKALAQENVPLSWNHPSLQPNTHTLFSWLEDLNKRHAQMRVWNKTGMLPKPKLQQDKLRIDDNYMFHGKLKTVWLGGLYNPLGLLTALRHEKAILCNALIDEVTLICEPLTLDQQNEGDLIIEGLHIQSAGWDNEAGLLEESEQYINDMPSVCVRAVSRHEMTVKWPSAAANGEGTGGEPQKEEQEPSEKDQHQFYNCPIFTTKNHAVLVAHLPLKTKTDPIIWQSALTCILLDKGAPENCVRRHQLIHPAKVQDLQVTHSDTDSYYLSRLNTALHDSALESKQRNTAGTAPGAKMPTPPSQLSYKALTPKAAPLPPSLSLKREGGHGRSDVPPPTKGASPAQTSRRTSRASVFKSINPDGSISRLSTPGSDKPADASVDKKRGSVSKPSSTKPTPRGSKGSTPVQSGSKVVTPVQSGSKVVTPVQSGSKASSPKAGQSPKASPSSPANSHRSTPKNSQPASPALSGKSVEDGTKSSSSPKSNRSKHSN